MARLSGVDFDSIEKGLSSVRVPGRMEIVASSDEESLAIVDYAHNELSFKTLFESVKNDYPGRKIIAVFGAPGGKAEERRECLPRVAAQYADFVIYTEEDPAHERVRISARNLPQTRRPTFPTRSSWTANKPLNELSELPKVIPPSSCFWRKETKQANIAETAMSKWKATFL